MTDAGVLYVLATLLPLLSFLIQVLVGRRLRMVAAYIAVAAIGTSFVLSFIGLVYYATAAGPALIAPGHSPALSTTHAESATKPTGESHAADKADGEPKKPASDEPAHSATAATGHGASDAIVWKGSFRWASFGRLTVRLGYYVDNLTVLMFFMVTLIASLIHIYSIGYMHEELHEPVHDPLAVPSGQPALHRRGRFARFFTYLSLFCFSMLGICLSDNIFLVFVFWELVGLCSYLLIGFYYERHSASTAANKAFITNRVGDFGMIIGLMIIWTTLGEFNFERIAQLLAEHKLSGTLLTIAGLGIFCGCVGKSAQFPLHVWLPDAMEGPTPVSALIHAATMVAAGVYLVGRFYFLFTYEALLVIAYTGGITLFMAGTIALVVTDIKRVLAYSTVSQLGYMMLGLGVGGWAAGLFHLLTHAFFKALLFLGSGSVIHGTGTQELPQMGGLFRKLPITALTMLVGVLAIAGIPLFSGFYSKDAIVAHALWFWRRHPEHVLLFLGPVFGAGITAFYMFRLYFMTFTGKPRDHHVHDHAHESPAVMWVPLAILAVPSICVGYSFDFGGGAHAKAPLLERILQYRPASAEAGAHVPHELHVLGGNIALVAVVAGIALSSLFYYFRVLKSDEVARQFPALHRFLLARWYFDELYAAVFLRPTLALSRFCRQFDWNVIDSAIDGTASWMVRTSDADGWFDFWIIDGIVNKVSDVVYGTANWLRVLQTGRLRQYVLFLVVGTVGLVAVISYLYPK